MKWQDLLLVFLGFNHVCYGLEGRNTYSPAGPDEFLAVWNQEVGDEGREENQVAYLPADCYTRGLVQITQSPKLRQVLPVPSLYF